MRRTTHSRASRDYRALQCTQYLAEQRGGWLRLRLQQVPADPPADPSRVVELCTNATSHDEVRCTTVDTEGEGSESKILPESNSSTGRVVNVVLQQMQVGKPVEEPHDAKHFVRHFEALLHNGLWKATHTLHLHNLRLGSVQNARRARQAAAW